MAPMDIGRDRMQVGAVFHFFFNLRAAIITILKLWCQPCLRRLELMTISGVDAMLILLCSLGVRALGPRWYRESKRSIFDVLLVASVGLVFPFSW